MKFDPAPLLTLAGYTCTHVPEHWEDIGDCENGPKIDGCEAHDLWTIRRGDTVEVIIVVDGKAVDGYTYPAYLDEQYEGWNNS